MHQVENHIANFNQAVTRAGRYVRQPSGYQAFVPKPLPPDPPVHMETLQALLSRADLALGRLDGSIRTLPDPNLFVRMYIRKEAVLSSRIEGTQSSLQDVLAAEANVLTPDRRKDAAEVLNHVRAMHHGLERLAQLPVSVRLILEIHAELMRGARGARLTPGALRTSQNWVGPAGCALHEAEYVPPPPHEVPAHLSELENFLHADTNLPPLVAIGLAHAQFETIHPFLNGNGRIGRLLITLLLCKREALLKPALCLSHYFNRRRRQYYDALQSVREAGTWEQWLDFFLRGVIEVGADATETTRNVLSLRERHRHIITERFGRAAGNGHLVLESLCRQPIVSIPAVQALIGTTYPTANNLVARMVDAGILSEVTGRTRNRRFMYQRYVELLHDNGADLTPPRETAAGTASPRLGFMAGHIRVPDDFDSMGAAATERSFGGTA